MSDVTRLLEAIQQGDSQAAEELLPLVYEELRKLAAHKMSNESAGHTLQPTALVHEAWLRLGGGEGAQFENRAHFFGAAAEAMRRILVERARRRQRIRHGGGMEKTDLEPIELAVEVEDEKVLAVNEALEELQAEDPVQAQIVKMKFFMGMQYSEIAASLDISEKSVQRHWAYAKAWLFQRIRSGR